MKLAKKRMIRMLNLAVVLLNMVPMINILGTEVNILGPDNISTGLPHTSVAWSLALKPRSEIAIAIEDAAERVGKVYSEPFEKQGLLQGVWQALQTTAVRPYRVTGAVLGRESHVGSIYNKTNDIVDTVMDAAQFGAVIEVSSKVAGPVGPVAIYGYGSTAVAQANDLLNDLPSVNLYPDMRNHGGKNVVKEQPVLSSTRF